MAASDQAVAKANERWPRKFNSGITRDGKYANLEYARFADDVVILIDAHPKHDWLLKAVDQRLREEFAKLQVQINDEKSRVVDLARGESFGYLGFDFRRVRSRQGNWRPHFTPKLKKRTELLRKLREIFRRYQSQPLMRVVDAINPILRGWVNYFAIGHSSRCFGFVKSWGRKEDPTTLDACPKTSRVWLGAMDFAVAVRNPGAVQQLPASYGPALCIVNGQGLITRGMKQTGERSARKTARYVRCGGGWKRDDGSRIAGHSESCGTTTGA
jgi:Group II intron, maturase-specific domain